jgi:predicted LPLAT superfamily acyltransferase
MSGNWLTQPERGSPYAMRLLIWVTLRLGRPIGRLFLYPICLYFMVFSLNARRASYQYLKRVLARPARFHEVFRHYHVFASTVHDRIYLLSGQHDYFDVTVHGAEAVQAARAKGGCILLGAHLGSFEILRAQGLFQQKLPVKMLMHEENAGKINQVLDGLHPDIAAHVIPAGRPEALLKVKECIERGEIVGILGDRTLSSDKVLACRFLGEEALFPEGPLRLAAILGAPLVLFFGLYRGGRRYDIYFEPFAMQISADPRNRKQELRTWAQRYAEQLERYCRLAPYNWFNFYDFWAKTAKSHA